jgi:hypothetical protein
MTRFPYLSGWCTRGSLQHHRCQTMYGRLQTLCTCKCHDVATADLDGQAELFDLRMTTP